VSALKSQLENLKVEHRLTTEQKSQAQQRAADCEERCRNEKQELYRIHELERTQWQNETKHLALLSESYKKNSKEELSGWAKEKSTMQNMQKVALEAHKNEILELNQKYMAESASRSERAVELEIKHEEITKKLKEMHHKTMSRLLIQRLLFNEEKTSERAGLSIVHAWRTRCLIDRRSAEQNEASQKLDAAHHMHSIRSKQLSETEIQLVNLQADVQVKETKIQECINIAETQKSEHALAMARCAADFTLKITNHIEVENKLRSDLALEEHRADAAREYSDADRKRLQDLLSHQMTELVLEHQNKVKQLQVDHENEMKAMEDERKQQQELANHAGALKLIKAAFSNASSTITRRILVDWHADVKDAASKKFAAKQKKKIKQADKKASDVEAQLQREIEQLRESLKQERQKTVKAIKEIVAETGLQIEAAKEEADERIEVIKVEADARVAEAEKKLKEKLKKDKKANEKEKLKAIMELTSEHDKQLALKDAEITQLKEHLAELED